MVDFRMAETDEARRNEAMEPGEGGTPSVQEGRAPNSFDPA